CECVARIRLLLCSLYSRDKLRQMRLGVADRNDVVHRMPQLSHVIRKASSALNSSISLCRIDLVQQRPACFEAADVVEDYRGGGRGVGCGGNMRRHDDARVAPEGMTRGQRLVVEDVEHGGREAAGGEGGGRVVVGEG